MLIPISQFITPPPQSKWKSSIHSARKEKKKYTLYGLPVKSYFVSITGMWHQPQTAGAICFLFCKLFLNQKSLAT